MEDDQPLETEVDLRNGQNPPLETEIDLRKGSKQPLETQDGGCRAVEDQSKSGSNANVNNATCDWAGRCTPIFGGAWEWRNINEKPYI